MTTIEQIHYEIDSAQDRLLQEAERIINETVVGEETKIEQKAERLKRIGFTSSVVVKQAEKVANKRSEKLKTVQVSKELAEKIRYYKQKYPLHKFITEKELDSICNKYGLIHAPVSSYIKDIPEKNLLDIENQKEIDNIDLFETTRRLVLDRGCFELETPSNIVDECCYNGIPIVVDFNDGWWGKNNENINKYFKLPPTTKYYKFNCFDYSIKKIDRDGFFIAAPPSHFNIDDLSKETKNGFFKVFKQEVKDPIVFRYVKGGILVITKWGDEASDELLINEIYN